MVAALPRHLTSLERFIGATLNGLERTLVRFVVVYDVGGLFQGVKPEVSEKMVRGYRVRSNSSLMKKQIANFQ